MHEPRWDKESLANLEISVYNETLTSFAGYASKDELFQAVAEMECSPDPEIRGRVITILYFLDRERAYSILVRFLEDPDESLRWGAVDLIAWYGEKITPHLIPLLQEDPCPDVRARSASVLGYFGTQEALPALKFAANNDHALEFYESKVSSYAAFSVKMIKSRYKDGARPYDPWKVRSLHEDIQVDREENLD